MDVQRFNPTYKNWHCASVVYGDLIFLSGVVADDKLLPLKEQAKQVFSKIDGTLAARGSNKSRLLSVLIHLADLSKKEEMNEVWKSWVDHSNLPARTCVGATLTPNTQIEVTVCAVKDQQA
jgi:enamine deaminase RidA (YjgF/YER057c/UK114 family)